MPCTSVVDQCLGGANAKAQGHYGPGSIQGSKVVAFGELYPTFKSSVINALEKKNALVGWLASLTPGWEGMCEGAVCHTPV